MTSRRLMCRVVALLGIGAGLLAAPALADCPDLVGWLDVQYATEVAVSSGYAYVAGADFRVIDVTTPALPFEVGVLGETDLGKSVAVSGDFAYHISGGGIKSQLDVIDVSTPSAPVWTGGCFWSRGAYDVAVSGHFAYVAGSWEHFPPNPTVSGLDVISVFTPSAPAEVGFLETPDAAYGVTVADGYAYVAAAYAGLRVIDVTTPALPFEVGFLATPDEAYGVVVEDGHAYVAGGSGLRVIDVTTPALPFEVGFLATPLPAWDVAVSRGYAYVAVGDWDSGGLYVIDVSTPSAPVEAGYREAGHGEEVGVAVSDGHVFLANYGGLFVFRECPFFSDGFESGDTSAWSATVP